MKMHKKINILTLAGLLAITYLSGLHAVQFAPYYDFKLTQGVSVPSRGTPEFTLCLANDLGFIARVHPKHSIVAFYELKYIGPSINRDGSSIRSLEGSSFTDRYIDYLFIVRHSWVYSKMFTFKTQVDSMIENTRTGANEAWGYGLYDFNRTGLMFSADMTFETFKLDASIQYSLLDFPNYTDLLGELQAGAGDGESQTGKQNHNILQIRSNLKYKGNKFSLGTTMQSYLKQKVVTSVVQANGTYYSAELQKENLISIGVERKQKVSEFLILSPYLSYKIKDSNQNYQHFTTAGSSVPVAYQGDYYDYTELTVGLPMIFILSEKWDLILTPELSQKNYSSRPPLDANNNFTDGKQANNLMLMNVAFEKKSSEVARWALFYSYQQQASNVRFEKYLPYNYSGSFFGIKYSLRY
ncbi:MAG: hypothetical protein A2252_01790 [Elusimicrobia bacterium RIFOXYA2_FULL_39_19]|nr:MAG: hypothetical protein A2252_01790 [Elusimicrobia bacterium RIFOXYA2_FULL_39_19]